MQRWSRLLQEETGLVALLWALGFTGLVAFLAIVVEGGLILIQRRDLQNAADAAALAGARSLVISDALAVSDAQVWAGKNVDALIDNEAMVFNDHKYVSATVGKNARSFFSDWLSFGQPRVHATATARLASPRLPGPGVFCIGVERPAFLAAQQTTAGVDLYSFTPRPPDQYYDVLRTGAGNSNAGYMDIDGGGADQNVRSCFESGSQQPLQPQEQGQTGISTGPAAQGLQARLEAAQGRGCYSWDEVRQSVIAWQADPSQPWRCSPYVSQATSVILVPILAIEDWGAIQGTTTLDLYRVGDDKPYVLAFYWLDAERTFRMTGNNWQFQVSGGQGQAQFQGVFLITHPTTLGTPPRYFDTGGLVDCDSALSVQCFIQLVN